MKVFNSIYLTRFFFLLFGSVVVLFAASFAMPILYFIAKTALISLLSIAVLDVVLIFSNKSPFEFKRIVANRLDLGESNEVILEIVNLSSQPINFVLHEGFPVEMQERSKKFNGFVKAHQTLRFFYVFKPLKRGDYKFSSPFIIIGSLFNFVNRKIDMEEETLVKVFPSITQMKKYELLVFQKQKTSSGIKKIRRIGNNSEFEQIRNYVQGDETKTINWKATSRRNELMVNQYQEEKSQNIYCILDKSRNMQGQFEEMTLLDYAINSTLVFSNIALKKGDKAGLFTFSDKIGTQLPADRSVGQMRKIHNALYSQKTHFYEANYELLYYTLSKNIRTRSLIVLFTNFETEFAMRRALPVLRQMNQKHVLVVVFFNNSELQTIAFQKVNNSNEVYQSEVAEKLHGVKLRIAAELNKNGIQTILTNPADLSINTINKYLELKAKGMV